MPKTYTPIATAIASGSSSDIAFTSIPQTYTDLVIVVSGSCTYAATDVLVQTYLNGDYSSVKYAATWLRGDGSSATSGRISGNSGIYVGYLPGASATSGFIGNIVMNYPSYAQANTYKPVLSRSNSSGTKVQATAGGTYQGTLAATTQINVATYGVGNFTAGTTFTLYGIKAA